MFRTSGALTCTVSSRQTGRHLTLRLRCSRRDPDGPKRWPTVPFDDATHVFVDDFDGEEIAMYAPSRGVIVWAPRATPAAQWTVAALMRYLAGADTRLIAQAELAAVSHCLRCERELTDPESIERGYGPDCYGEVTGSRPERAVA
jgi:hypothetical protein